MADTRRDKPPILRALVLLVALVFGALALAALSPAAPETSPTAGPDGSATGASERAPATRN